MTRAMLHNYDPFSSFRNELDRSLADMFGAMANLPAGTVRSPNFPALNAWENEERLFIEAEVPGLRMEDLELTVTGSELSIRGKRSEKEGENLTYHRRERGTGTFSRVVRLPYEVDSAAVNAMLKNGVLTIQLPKAMSAKPRRISVTQ